MFSQDEERKIAELVAKVDAIREDPGLSDTEKAAGIAAVDAELLALKAGRTRTVTGTGRG